MTHCFELNLNFKKAHSNANELETKESVLISFIHTQTQRLCLLTSKNQMTQEDSKFHFDIFLIISGN